MNFLWILGLMETHEIVKSGAQGVGNPVVYVGSTTGRDGMGGASFASAELSADSLDDRPAVQVGDPFQEKLLLEATLELAGGDAVVFRPSSLPASWTPATSWGFLAWIGTRRVEHCSTTPR